MNKFKQEKKKVHQGTIRKSINFYVITKKINLLSILFGYYFFRTNAYATLHVILTEFG